VEIVTRKEALINNLPRYFTGKKCKHGHLCEKTINGGCIECGKIRDSSPETKKKRKDRASKWNKDFIEKRRERERSIIRFRKNSIKPTTPYPENSICDSCGFPETIIDKRYGKIKRLAVDHCHETNKFRGWLCQGCNTALGQLKDDSKRIESLLNYKNNSLTKDSE
jgi:hypothetical protein